MVIPIVNSSPPQQNGHHFAHSIFKGIFMNEKLCILIWILQKYVLEGQIDDKSAFIQVIA